MEGKHERAVEYIRQAVATFLSGESNRESLITVTSVNLSKDNAHSTIFVTVYPDEKTNAALDFLNRKRDDVRDYVKAHTKLRRIPFFNFEIDAGEKHRQHMDELFNEERR